MTFSAFLLAAITVLPADRLAMADRLFNRGEYAAARAEYAALDGEKSVPAEELLYRLAECDRAMGKSAEARREYGELIEKFPTSARADRARLMRALAGTPEERTSELKVLDSDRVAADIRAAALYYLGSAANDPETLARSVRLDPKGKYAPYADFHRAAILVKSPDAPGPPQGRRAPSWNRLRQGVEVLGRRALSRRRPELQREEVQRGRERL